MQNDPELELAIFMAHGKINTFISVNRVKDEVVDNPDKFPILSKETVKTIKGEVTRYCNRKHWKPTTSKHTGMVFQRPNQKLKRRAQR